MSYSLIAHVLSMCMLEFDDGCLNVLARVDVWLDYKKPSISELHDLAAATRLVRSSSSLNIGDVIARPNGDTRFAVLHCGLPIVAQLYSYFSCCEPSAPRLVLLLDCSCCVPFFGFACQVRSMPVYTHFLFCLMAQVVVLYFFRLVFPQGSIKFITS